MQWARGGIAYLEVFYVSGVGVPVDPVNPLVDVLDPDGAPVVVDGVPIRDGVGHYHYLWPVPVDAQLGAWDAVWTGTIDGSPAGAAESFDVVLEPAASLALYGASLAGVKALLPHRGIDATTKPSADEVEGFIEGAAGRVFAAVGSLDALPHEALPALGGESVFDQATRLARRAVHLDAASIAEAASAPELARPNDATSYAQWLQDQYTSSMADLLALVDRYEPGDGVLVEGAEVDIGEPAWSFPAPGVTELTGF